MGDECEHAEMLIYANTDPDLETSEDRAAYVRLELVPGCKPLSTEGTLGGEKSCSDFGSKLWTYFVSPVTGQCNFYIASDDNGELRLSPNANPSEAVLIASVIGSGADGWTLPGQGFKYAAQKSGLVGRGQ